MRRFAPTVLMTVALAATVAACGGGGSDASAPPPAAGIASPAPSPISTPTPTPTPTPVPVSVELEGNVFVSAALAASVCLDLNKNFKCDTDEPSAPSDASGKYRLTIPAATSAKLAGDRLIAYLPLGTVLPEAGVLSEDRVLLTKPYEAAVREYNFSPLSTRVELVAMFGVSRANAQTAVAAQSGLSALNAYSDYIKERTGPNSLEAEQAIKTATEWFEHLNVPFVAAVEKPSSAYFNDYTGDGVFSITSLPTSSPSDPAAGVSIRDGYISRSSAQAISTTNAFRRQLGLTFFHYFYHMAGLKYSLPTEGAILPADAFYASGWVTSSTEPTGTVSLKNNRIVLTAADRDTYAYVYQDVDVSGLPVQLTDFDVVGKSPVLTDTLFDAGAKRFPRRMIVYLQRYAEALPPERPYNAFGAELKDEAAFTTIDQFFDYYQLDKNRWRPLDSFRECEISFVARDSVRIRKTKYGSASNTNPLVEVPLSTYTFGGQTIYRVALPPQSGLTCSGGQKLELTEFQNTVRVVTFHQVGDSIVDKFSRLNRQGAQSVVRGLGWILSSPWPF